MPELIAGGPSIPVHLFNELDSGKVVFFAGAGISEGPGSELPGFAALVRRVYSDNHLTPDAIERAALDLDGLDDSRRKPNFDKALGLLERDDRLGASALRNTVVKLLSRPATGPLRVHQALIALSRSDQGVRLITTNFDNRFIQAGVNERLVDAAPKLPIPRPHNWFSLVHLHGRIVEDDDCSDLVLTAADFGRAYLTEGWAARFVTELFREFTVVFIGYSVGDPVMGYMVDALAAERAKGAQFSNAYAFADHDGTKPGKEKAQEDWLAKNVGPILYDRRDQHRLLNDTLIEWERIRNDPFQVRSQIAIGELTKLPGGPTDPTVERVTWALQDPVAAQALADAPPIVDKNEFSKVGEWLEMFAQCGLLRCAASDTLLGFEGHGPAFVRLVDTGYQDRNPHSLDMVRLQLARWIAGHLHVPQVLAWVVCNGGYMHPGLRQEIERLLADQSRDIPSRMRLLWTVLLQQEPIDPFALVWAVHRYENARSSSERRSIEDEVVRTITPRLVVRSGPGPRLAFQQRRLEPIDACGYLRLEVGNEEKGHLAECILKDGAVLLRHAETFSGHLDQALALADDDDEERPQSFYFRPSIAPHEQNESLHRNDFAPLIDLARDGYFALCGSNRARADSLLRRWAQSSRPLLQRLALHALAENVKSDTNL